MVLQVTVCYVNSLKVTVLMVLFYFIIINSNYNNWYLQRDEGGTGRCGAV